MSGADIKQEFDQLVRETHAHVRAYIAGMGIAPHEVDDVAQDVYLEYYRNFHKRPPDAAPERWIKGIARNLCLNHIRRRARRGRLHHEALAELLSRTETGLERSLSEGSVFAALDGCCDKLPDGSRKLLTMRYAQDLPAAAIAAAVNSTSEAVRVALFRIRAALRDCIAASLAEER